MKSKVFGTALATIALAVSLAGQDVAREQKLQQAIDLLETKGNASAAMPLLEEVAKSADQALAARGLLYLGQAQERQGSDLARKTYERIIRQFGSQSAVVEQARARLAALTTPRLSNMPTNRMVWQPPSSFFWFTGDVSNDGKLTFYTDWEGDRYDLNAYDLTTGKSRRVLAGGVQPNGSWEAATATAASRDSTQLAYSWSANTGSTKASDELRVISLRPGEVPKPRTLVRDPSIASLAPRDWSPDGQLIAIDLERRDRMRQIAVVSVRTGEMRVLKDVVPRRTSGMQFSPDGRYLMFDLPGPTNNDRDILAIELSSGQELRVVTFPGDDSMLGWTPDGKEMLFSSSRSGSPGLWAAPFVGGKTGRASLVRSGLSLDAGLGVPRNGAFYYAPETQAMNEIKLGKFDARSGRFTAVPSDVPVDRVGGNGAPRLSPDGKSLGFIARRRDGFTLVVRNLETGATRHVPLPLRDFRNGNARLWRWNFDGTAILAIGANLESKSGIHRIDASTGQLATTIPAELPGLSIADDNGTRVIYWIDKGGSDRDFVLAEWELGTSRSRELYRSSTEACRVIGGRGTLYCPRDGSILRRNLTTGTVDPIASYEPGRAWQVSPDERYVVTGRSTPGSTLRTIWITDTTTGKAREMEGAQGTFIIWWSPLGNGVVAMKSGAKGAPNEGWWFPLDGTAPHRIPELDGTGGEPDKDHVVAGQFAFTVPIQTNAEPWDLFVLENFLPQRSK